MSRFGRTSRTPAAAAPTVEQRLAALEALPIIRDALEHERYAAEARADREREQAEYEAAAPKRRAHVSEFLAECTLRARGRECSRPGLVSALYRYFAARSFPKVETLRAESEEDIIAMLEKLGLKATTTQTAAGTEYIYPGVALVSETEVRAEQEAKIAAENEAAAEQARHDEEERAQIREHARRRQERDDLELAAKRGLAKIGRGEVPIEAAAVAAQS